MKKQSRTLGWIGMGGLALGLGFAYGSNFNKARIAMSLGFTMIGTVFAALHIWAVKK